MPATWHRGLESVPGPTILIANEFLDALPIRQFMRSGDGWRERWWACGMAPSPSACRATRCRPASSRRPCARPRRALWWKSARPSTSLAAALAARGAPLAALFIDYGHATSRGGETLQAVKAHRPVDPLAEPGEADLTAHVDFEAFATAVREAGLAAGPAIPQRDLLFGLGLAARAERLASARPEAFDTLRAGVERLIDPAPTGMGALFKAIAIASDAALLARLPLARD